MLLSEIVHTCCRLCCIMGLLYFLYMKYASSLMQYFQSSKLIKNTSFKYLRMFCVQVIQKVKMIALIVIVSRLIAAWSLGTLKLKDLNYALLTSSRWHFYFHTMFHLPSPQRTGRAFSRNYKQIFLWYTCTN